MLKQLAAVTLTGLTIFASTIGTAHASTTPDVSYATSATYSALTNRPALGYNTWYEYDASINQADILAQAQALVSSGLAGSGYKLVALDDGWQAPSSSDNGAMTWNTTEFPNGIPWLAQQLHSMGLYLGIYTAIGSHTCADSGAFPGAWGNFQADANLFKSWGVTYVKVDECGGYPSGTTNASLTAAYKSFGTYLHDDDLAYSEELPVYAGDASPSNPNWGPDIAASSTFANYWRVAPDESSSAPAMTTILGHLAADLHLHGYAGPGHWNDLDMVVTGNTERFSYWTGAQDLSQLEVWAMEASPLLVSSDIASWVGTAKGDQYISALRNSVMLAIDQSGSQAAKEFIYGTYEVVEKPADGGTSVLLINTGTTTKSYEIPFSYFGISAGTESVRNVYGSTVTTNKLRDTLGPDGTALFVLKDV